jgi:hypothetical protein
MFEVILYLGENGSGFAPTMGWRKRTGVPLYSGLFLSFAKQPLLVA